MGFFLSFFLKYRFSVFFIYLSYMTTKICKKCNTEEPIEMFYQFIRKGKKYRSNMCNECRRHKARVYRKERYYLNRDIPVFDDPDNFANEEDKQLVEDCMRAMKWIYDEPSNTWWKPGVKNLDGTWVKMIEAEQRQLDKHYGKLTDELVDKIIREKLNNVRPIYMASKYYGVNYRELTYRIKKKTNGKRLNPFELSQEKIEEIKEYHKKNPKIPKSKIGREFGLAPSQIYEII